MGLAFLPFFCFLGFWGEGGCFFFRVSFCHLFCRPRCCLVGERDGVFLFLGFFLFCFVFFFFFLGGIILFCNYLTFGTWDIK
jgi:hypothetical protein